jgi:VanZ family protein
MTGLRKAAGAGAWAPPLLLMAVIFALSAQPDLNSGLGLADTIGRKLIHASEYALLSFLWWRALRTVTSFQPALRAAVAISIAYSVSDEFHQSFVDGRHASPVDVLIDSMGALVAALLLARARQAARAR